MAVDKDKIISEFGLHFSGQKMWMIGSKPIYKCPKCGNPNPTKLAIIFGETGVSSWKCVKCSAHMRLEALLWKIGRRDLISKFKTIQQDDILEKRYLITEKFKATIIKELPRYPLPVLFKRIYDSEYLNSRGCVEEIYNKWIIGYTNFQEELKDYIIFILQENNTNVGWVARSLLDKKVIDKYNEEVKEYNRTAVKGKEKKQLLRWKNSPDTNFEEIVFGLDEITDKTETIICEEGITSKLGTDVKLELFKDESTKCVCTFGKKISSVQIKKIYLKGPNIKNFILFYDPDAVSAIKQYAFDIQKVFPNVFIAFNPIKNKNGGYKDPGDLSLEEFEETFDKLKTPFQFWNTQLPLKKLTKN